MNRAENTEPKIYSKLEIAFIAFVIWSAGGATVYQSFLYSPNSIATIPIVLICAYLLKTHGIVIINRICVFIGLALLLWGTLGTSWLGYNCQYYYLVYNIFLSYVIWSVYRKDLWYLYEKIMVFFAVISLIVFFAVILVPDIANVLKTISVEKQAGLWESNILICGLAKIDPSAAILFPRRNLGFAWEPGRFAVLVVFALFINLIINNFNLKKNRNFWILFITLITTQSTTGYGCFLIVVLLFFYNTKYKRFLIPVSVFIVVIFSSLSFLNEKIISTWYWETNQKENFDSQMLYYAQQDINYVPQRFEGMYYDILNFLHSPIWGYGADYKNSYVNTELFKGARIYASDGAIQIFASCGLLVGTLLYFLLLKSSVLLSNLYEYKGKWLFFMLFFLVNFSYNFWGITIFDAMIFISIFYAKQGKIY